MATVSPTVADVPVNGNNGKAKVATWTAITTTNTVGAIVSLPNCNHATIQLTGTFGAAATIVMEGSNNGTTFFTLTNTANTALSSLTAAAGHEVSEHPLFYRPRLASGGDGSTSITVSMFLTE